MLSSHWECSEASLDLYNTRSGSKCLTSYFFQSYEGGRELGGGSRSRPKATSGVRAGRESELRRDNETGDAETWVGKNRAAWVGKNRQISREMRRNISQKSALLFSLC